METRKKKAELVEYLLSIICIDNNAAISVIEKRTEHIILGFSPYGLLNATLPDYVLVGLPDDTIHSDCISVHDDENNIRAIINKVVDIIEDEYVTVVVNDDCY